MHDHLQQPLADTLAYLMALHSEGVRPETARTRLHSLQEQHPATPLELLWEEESFDGSVHYDALLHLHGAGCVSLSFCPEQTLPWPLRGVRRWREHDLVRVNNTLLTVGEAIAHLDFLWQEASLVNRLVDTCLIREKLTREPINLTDAELQCAMDVFRKAHQLYTAADTYRWLQQHSLTHAQCEQLVAHKATLAKLRDRLTAHRIEGYFEAHRADFDTVQVARLEMEDESCAVQLCAQLRAGEVDFYTAAQQHFLASAARAQPLSGVLFAVVQRRQVPVSLAKVLFAAAPHDIVGPVSVMGRYAILRLLSMAPARLDGPTRLAIEDLLFEEWLAQQRQAATIEWNWG